MNVESDIKSKNIIITKGGNIVMSQDEFKNLIKNTLLLK